MGRRPATMRTIRSLSAALGQSNAECVCLYLFLWVCVRSLMNELINTNREPADTERKHWGLKGCFFTVFWLVSERIATLRDAFKCSSRPKCLFNCLFIGLISGLISSLSDIYTHTHTHTHTYIYIHAAVWIFCLFSDHISLVMMRPWARPGAVLWGANRGQCPHNSESGPPVGPLTGSLHQ